MIFRYIREALARRRRVPATRHFAPSEFACHDGTEVPRKYYASTQLLMEQLEVLREYLGGQPIDVISGYRSKAHNKRVKGKKHSKHVLGQAADIRVPGFSPREIADAIEQLTATGRMVQGGLGRYRSFTHYDVRGKRARWGSNE